MKKNREFHDNESENISCESKTPFSLWNNLVFFLVKRNSSNKRSIGGAALIRGRRLIEGGAHSSKYGKLKLNQTLNIINVSLP